MDEQTYEGGGEASLDDTPEAPFPALGTPEFDRLNNRRGELIAKDVRGAATAAERHELEWLERECGKALDRAFPGPGLDWAMLDRFKTPAEGDGDAGGDR